MNFKKASALCEERLRPYPHIGKQWGRTYEDIEDNLHVICEGNAPQIQILSTMFRRLHSPYHGCIPSEHEIAILTGLAYSTVKENVSFMASQQGGRGPLLLRTVEKGKQTGIDLAPALALIDRAIAQQERQKQKRSHHAQRPALVASIAAQPLDQAGAPASMEQEQPAAARQPARTKRAAQRPGQQEQEAPRKVEAPALPEQCIAALVAFLDAQRINTENNLTDLVAFACAQRPGLDDSALLVALQRATAQASADIARNGSAIATPFGLLTHKMKEAIAQQEQERADQARRIDAQQEQQKAMLAGLDESGQRFYAYGSAHDWPGFVYGRQWSGYEDWLTFAHLSDDGTKNTVLASFQPASAPAPMEQPDQAPTVEASAGAAPLDQAPDQQELQTSPAPAPYNVTPIGSRVNSRKELMRTAARKGYPAIRIPGAGLIAGNGDAWERFSNNADHKNIQKALGLLAARPDAPDQGSAPASPIGPAPAPAPSSEAPGAPAQGSPSTRPALTVSKMIDKAARWANDSAAGLL